jgi:hypothetical protein
VTAVAEPPPISHDTKVSCDGCVAIPVSFSIGSLLGSSRLALYSFSHDLTCIRWKSLSNLRSPFPSAVF